MHKIHLQQSIKLAQNMIRAFYTEGNIDKIFKHMNHQNFTWTFGSAKKFLSNAYELRELFNKIVELAKISYEIFDEEYQIAGSSEDSCIIIANVTLADKIHPHDSKIQIYFLFYFQILNGQVVCSSFNANNITPNSQITRFQYFYNPELDIKSPLVNINNIAVKSFAYEENFPYIYINLKFIDLITANQVQGFTEASKNSSLAQIHPKDQPRYIETLERCKVKALNRNSYFIKYRMQTLTSDELFVLEWGSIEKIDDRFIVKALIFPIEEVEENSDLFPSSIEKESGLSNLQRYGIHIGSSLIIHQRQRQIEIDGNKIDLTPVEYELLLVLLEHLNEPVDTSEIYKIVWSSDALQITSNTLKMHVSNLRKKLKISSDSRIQINFYRGEGYCLSLKDEQ